jgi:two-component system nitrate/nitrite sensor histidine kinase NarX
VELAERWRQGVQVELELEIQHEPPLVLPHDEATQVLRVLGESLQNVARHARARSVRVGLAREGDQVRLSVEDDGCGFDPERDGRGPGGFGLSIMRARASRLGGTLEVRTAPGQGTCLELRWPAHEALWLEAMGGEASS